MPDRTESEVIVETATRAAGPTVLAVATPEAAAAYSLPDGVHIETVDLERLLPSPRRKKGVRHLTEAASLVAYVTEHATGGTHLYGNVDQARITACIDDHHRDGAGWQEHKAILTMHPTAEWTRWKSRDGQFLNQIAFAEFIEDGLREIAEPAGADLLEIAQTFQANTKVAFRTSTILANGQRQLQWEETIEAKAGQKGQLTIPERLRLVVVPFEGMEPVQVDARLRFRIREGELSIGYKLDRPDQVERDYFAQVVGIVQTGTGITPLMGTE